MRGISVEEAGGWGPALAEAVRLRGQMPQPAVDVTVISPEELQEVEDDEHEG